MTSCCLYKYYIDGNYWYYDFSKPASKIYSNANIVLQSGCIVFLIITDFLIVIKLYQLRKKNEKFFVKSKFTKGGCPKLNKEFQLAIDFFVLNFLFIFASYSFNFLSEATGYVKTMTIVVSALNQAKWAFYAFGNQRIQESIFCKNANQQRNSGSHMTVAELDISPDRVGRKATSQVSTMTSTC
ncbi:hypothetical protein WR25_15195 [Diploscapter pachys]|uniref:7TM GPCR serpentine receptor class x (Srx) domain-containing protein n=1 Tax=Diploscapter pachys TaxID=2018661 RepID=A0A2A2K086_9BILA|nr:hypothetical protein WR25_15195 [Diploscapter pachys]